MTEALESLGFAPFGVIVAICFGIGLAINYISNSVRAKTAIPAIMMICGAGIGVVMFFTSPEFKATAGEFWWALAIGGVSGLSATGVHQLWKQHVRKDELAEAANNVTTNSDDTTVNNANDTANVVTENNASIDSTNSQNINNEAIIDDAEFNSGVTVDDVDPTSGGLGETPEGFSTIPINDVDPTAPTIEDEIKGGEI